MSAADKSVWSGVYTADQAHRGAVVYGDACARCHQDDLSGYTGLRGEKFFDNWREDSLASLWARVSKTMPAGAPGSLEEQKYLDVLAFILQANDIPPGQQELTVSGIHGIRFQAKEGPRPVPDFALVQTTGCLVREPDGVWRLLNAAEPVRTRNPHAESVTGAKLGTAAFRLLDDSALKAATHDHRKALVKGFLIRKPNDDRLNPTAIQLTGGECP